MPRTRASSAASTYGLDAERHLDVRMHLRFHRDGLRGHRVDHHRVRRQVRVRHGFGRHRSGSRTWMASDPGSGGMASSRGWERVHCPASRSARCGYCRDHDRSALCVHRGVVNADRHRAGQAYLRFHRVVAYLHHAGAGRAVFPTRTGYSLHEELVCHRALHLASGSNAWNAQPDHSASDRASETSSLPPSVLQTVADRASATISQPMVWVMPLTWRQTAFQHSERTTCYRSVPGGEHSGFPRHGQLYPELDQMGAAAVPAWTDQLPRKPFH